MRDRLAAGPVLAAFILAAVAGLGLDLLFRHASIGINAYLLGLLLLGTVLLLRARKLVELPRASLRLIGGASLCLASFAWRDSEALNFLAWIGTVTLVGLAAHRAHGGKLAPAGYGDYLLGLMRSWFGMAVGILPLAHQEIRWSRVVASDTGRRRIAIAGRGVVLALPPVLIFASLFASADPVFKSVYESLLQIDLSGFFSHAVIIGFGAWWGAGIGRELFIQQPRSTTLPTARGGFSEVRIVLSAVLFVFLLFDAIQLNVLFGGRAFVEAHSNLTYAEYARSGFFHLSAAAALVLPLLLLADALVPRNEEQQREFRALASVLLVLLGVVLVSALQRMRIYQLTFGLTELRVYTMAFMVWLALVLAWFGATVLRDRRERFMPGAAVLGLTLILALHLLNPDRLIARVNLDRAAAGLRFDRAYVISLSADALPEMMDRLARVDTQTRCQLSHRILASRFSRTEPDWRSWNLSRAAALVQVQDRVSDLRTWSGECVPPRTRPS
jgi:hypothetical protein